MLHAEQSTQVNDEELMLCDVVPAAADDMDGGGGEGGNDEDCSNCTGLKLLLNPTLNHKPYSLLCTACVLYCLQLLMTWRRMVVRVAVMKTMMMAVKRSTVMMRT
jgi:hypothetical protein